MARRRGPRRRCDLLALQAFVLAWGACSLALVFQSRPRAGTVPAPRGHLSRAVAGRAVLAYLFAILVGLAAEALDRIRRARRDSGERPGRDLR